MDNFVQPVIDYIKEHEVKLEKPIVFFDLETTGVDTTKDRVVEFDAVRINPDYTTEQLYYLIDPEMHIPDEASSVNQICDDDVKGKPKFAEVADEINEFFGGKTRYDIGGFNITHFDIPILVEEFKRSGKNFLYGGRNIVDAYKVLVKAEPRNLKSIYKNFTGNELQGAHRAHADTAASALIAFMEMGKYGLNTAKDMFEFGNEGMVDSAGFFKRNQEGTIVFALGKYKGRSVVDVYNNANDKSYFENYIMAKCGSDVKNHLTLILNGKEK